jgi:hypothetical protein
MDPVSTTVTDAEAPRGLSLAELPPAMLRQIAEAHRQAHRLLQDATVLVRQQQELEGALVALGAIEDEDTYEHLREATGLVALDSVLGNAAVAISAPGGGLWCAGAPRPWPATAWQLDDHPEDRAEPA